MALKTPVGVKTEQAPHLYFKKYPHKISLSCSDYQDQIGRWESWGKWTQSKLGKALLVKAIDGQPHRVRRNWYATTYFFEQAAHAQHFIDALEPYLFDRNVKNVSVKGEPMKILNMEVCTMSDDQAKCSIADAKIVYRKTKFHNQFTWRIEIKGALDADTYEAVEAQVFEPEQIAARAELYIKYPHSNIRNPGSIFSNTNGLVRYGSQWGKTVIYTDDEDVAAMVRLVISAPTKIFKAVLTSDQLTGGDPDDTASDQSSGMLD